jgi:hypothetical protein
MFSWCFCGVLAVFRWCFGGIEETVFLWSKMVPRAIPNWRQRRCETLLLGLYAVLISYFKIYARLFLITFLHQL